MSGTNATLTFEGLDFNNYYPVPAADYNGYQGFNYIDMGLLTQSAIQWLGYGNGTGYSNVIDGTTCAFTYVNQFGHGGGSGFGGIISSYAGETFNLKSGVFASAWCSRQPTYFEAFNERGHVTATVEFPLSQTVTTIDFANYGTEFKHIFGLKIISEPGGFGVQGFKGYQIAMDDIQVRWNGPIPHSHQSQSHQPRAHASPLAAAALAEGLHAGSHEQHSGGVSSTHYHSELESLLQFSGHDGGGDLTAQFSLPTVDQHFGT